MLWIRLYFAQEKHLVFQYCFFSELYLLMFKVCILILFSSIKMSIWKIFLLTYWRKVFSLTYSLKIVAYLFSHFLLHCYLSLPHNENQLLNFYRSWNVFCELLSTFCIIWCSDQQLFLLLFSYNLLWEPIKLWRIID